MSRSAKGGGGSGKGSSMFAGVVLGMVLGLATAGGVAWYILKKNPASFENKEYHEAPKPEAAIPPLAKSAPVPANVPVAAASAVVEPKQHFEFYKVLTDKQDGAVPKATEKPAAKEVHSAPAAQQAKPAANAKEIFYVQAGSFPNQDDAEKLKAKLALLGMEASLQTATIPDKGTFHRVRLGPFKGADEMNRAMALLKQNGVANATPIKAQ
ncbi:MAG: SPOR domain-containing protein [Gallionellaceae bacterium]|jgi:cell division protein FtsN